METEILTRLTAQALLLVVVLSLAALGGALAGGLLGGLLDRSVGSSRGAASTVLRLLGAATAVAAAAPWIGRQTLAYGTQVLRVLGGQTGVGIP